MRRQLAIWGFAGAIGTGITLLMGFWIPLLAILAGAALLVAMLMPADSSLDL